MQQPKAAKFVYTAKLLPALEVGRCDCGAAPAPVVICVMSQGSLWGCSRTDMMACQESVQRPDGVGSWMPVRHEESVRVCVPTARVRGCIVQETTINLQTQPKQSAALYVMY
jgi:hypothetical protein